MKFVVVLAFSVFFFAGQVICKSIRISTHNNNANSNKIKIKDVKVDLFKQLSKSSSSFVIYILYRNVQSMTTNR